MDRSVNNFVKFYHDFGRKPHINEEEDKKPVPKRASGFSILKRETTRGSDFEQKRKKQDRFFPGNPALLLGSVSVTATEQESGAESAVCKRRRMPDGWRYPAVCCSENARQDPVANGGAQLKIMDMHSALENGQEQTVATASSIKQPQR